MSVSAKYATRNIEQKTGLGFVILNPVAGKGQPEKIKEILSTSLGKEQYVLYETTGDESLPDVVRTAVEEDHYVWVAAVGGDGTVSQVVNGLIGTDVPLVILPGGTANVLAQDLNIPQDIEAACQLLMAQGTLKKLDAICVNNRHFVHQIGIGLESTMLNNTPTESKNSWGMAAYLWTAVKEAFGWQPHTFTLTIDGETHQLKASELAISNAGNIGAFGLKWDEEIRPDDGRIDVVLIRARSIADYAQVIWALIRGEQRASSHFRVFSAYNEIRVETDRQLPVHGDGEIYENMLPFTAVVVPDALTVIAPARHATKAQ